MDEAETSPKSRHAIAFNKNGRRSTLLAIPPTQLEEPPVDNPNNSDAENQQLRREYESVQSINRVLEGVIEDFAEAGRKIHQFSETVNQANKLLDIWVEILEKTQDVKSVLEDDTWKPNSRKRRASD
ncbi:hypothetical protein [Parasitella parasitica]|uniref:DASH complex subunit DUO1 n=1 Tax=Parasitella parasitica TaxID=35722 RepID=A0A0B7NMJ6_9FUNG|nr:hypothetical protein [Parasitella parasitica]